MRYARGHNEATRERIVAAATRLFRDRGVAAVGLAKIMAEAGLTVGTFYTHFESKEALLRETLLRAIRAGHAELEQVLREGDLETAIRAYLHPRGPTTRGSGCPVTVLASEVARQSRATREAFARDMTPTFDSVGAVVSRGRGEAVSRADAAAFFGLLIGTLLIADATPDRADAGAVREAGVRAALRLASADDSATPIARARAR